MLDIIPLRTTEKNRKKVVFLPYAGGYAASFHGYTDNFDDTYDVFAIEYPGRNTSQLLSSTPTYHDLCSLIAHTILKVSHLDTYLVGVSMGGYAAFKVAQIFETALQQPLKHVYLLSVTDEISLMSALSDSNNWCINMPTDFSKNEETEMAQQAQELMMFDRSILMTMQLDNSFLKKTPLTIINGEKDRDCHALITKKYWKKKGLFNFHYRNYPGGHIPKPVELNGFFE